MQIAKHLVCVAVLAASLAAQVLAPRAAFPPLQGQDLDDQKITLPDAASGKVVVVIMTFSKGAGDRSRVWQDHLLKDYPDEQHFTSYAVAMLSDAPGFVRGMIRSAMKKGTPPPLRHRTITVTSDSKPWKERVGMTSDKPPYLLLLDAKGRLVWSYSGEFEEKPYSELKGKIAEMVVSGK